MEAVKRFRSYVVRLALALTAVAACAALAVDMTVAKCVAMGGLAGVLGFWVLVRHTEFAISSADGVQSRTRRWISRTQQGVAARFVLYGLVLVAAYRMDREELRGFFGAAVGLLIIRLAITVVGVAGWDLKETEQQDGTHR
jgi:hypothetical protein